MIEERRVCPFEMDGTACSLQERYYTNFKINFYWLSLLFLLNKPKKKWMENQFYYWMYYKKKQQQQKQPKLRHTENLEINFKFKWNKMSVSFHLSFVFLGSWKLFMFDGKFLSHCKEQQYSYLFPHCAIPPCICSTQDVTRMFQQILAKKPNR